ncbi:hypothetical protein BDDG_09392, partial [Blastomyces dermatitidis ATCC 18188]
MLGVPGVDRPFYQQCADIPLIARHAIRYKAIQSSRKMLAGSCLTSFVCTSLTRQTHSPLSGCKRQKTSSCIVWTAPERRLLFQQLQSFYKSSTNVRELLAPEKAQGLPSDWGFSGFIKTAAHQVLDEIPFMKAEEFHGPLFRRLGIGIIINSHPCIKGEQIFHLCHNHWSCIIRDLSSTFNTKPQENHRDYLLKSELLAVTSIFYHQMNEMEWLSEEGRYMPKLIYKEGFLIVCSPPLVFVPPYLQPIGNVPNTHLDTEGYIQP